MVKTKVTWTGSPTMKLNELRRAIKPEMAHLGRVWHTHMLPRHFGLAAKSRYKYQKRGKGYSIDKAKAVGHNRPLEFTGDLKAMVIRRGQVSSTGRGVRVRMTGPQYLYQYRKDLEQPDKAAELTAMNLQDTLELEGIFQTRVEHRLNTITTTEVRS